jgi:DNA-binding NarL/FixJ family response regulator
LSALEAGVHGYVPKGLGAQELSAALKMILDGTIYVPPAVADRNALSQSEAAPQRQPADVRKPVLEVLTPRQRDVLELLVQGDSNKLIARKLGLGEGTVKIHLAALFRNLGVKNRAAAAVAGASLLSPRGEDVRPG